MPKSSLSFNPAEYALVADRITLFYERYPTGRIVTELISRDRDVVFKASAFRLSTDLEAAATGWASEREGDGEINEVACLENTETSAIGRALANLGFTASLKRASREEMEKAERARSRIYRTPEQSQLRDRVAERSEAPYVLKNRAAKSPNVPTADRTSDVMALVVEAGKRGMPPEYLEELEQRIKDGDVTLD